MRNSISGALALLAFTPPLFLGCSGEGGPGPAAGAPTFHRDVEPLLQKRCMSCHSPGNIAPFSLTTYEEARTVAPLLATATRERTMPPWNAVETDECQPPYGWKEDVRLTDDEIALVDMWAAAGAPQGDPADAPPAFVPEAGGLRGAELEVAPRTPFVASGEADQFRCFVMDPGITETRYLNGVHVVPGNASVVHHALVFLDREGAAEELADQDGGYDCFGGPGIAGELLSAWAPGGVPLEFEPNIGAEIPAGARLVMQVHYHPAGATAEPDTTRVQMRFTEGVPEYQMGVALIGNFAAPSDQGGSLLPGPNDTGGVEFLIPAGAEDHVETMQLRMPASVSESEVYLYGAGTHMHYVGTDMKVSLTREASGAGEPEQMCLVQTPAWDFSWQRGFYYDAPIEQLPRLHAGDLLTMRCVYNNSTSNPFLVKALKEQHLPGPVDVHLGESTLDEMCLGALIYLTKNE
ncbi:hypothetical protein SOCE26_064530 [Sorangium cellulosum]|uniref:Cytochrome c domain-containing protein n=1 Tax=Sorangium cellulosum TaxID=56 RepID=A0A2L0F0C8_SORCE|nr:hypothetical protein [Sorangium cellulosum]AUX44983.1 hypothetical protein SOCE26_064530 [Sorangium cellulosum]